MRRYSINQEEVIMRLTEIYHGLEEVESLLNSNITQQHKWQCRSAEQIRKINERILAIERGNIFCEHSTLYEKSKGLDYQNKLKLTVGY